MSDIPKIVHIIWWDRGSTGKAKLPREYQICLMSVILNNPTYEIILHTNKAMDFDMLNSMDFTVSEIEKDLLDRAIEIGIIRNTDKINKREVSHLADWLRYNYLYNIGGIYVDTDIVTLKPFDDLLRYDLVVAKETSKAVCCGVMLSKSNLSVIKNVIYDYINDYHKNEWSYNCQKRLKYHIDECFDSNVCVLDLKQGWHYPKYAIFHNNPMIELEIECKGINSFKDTERYFPYLRGHHLWGHSNRTIDICRDIANFDKEVYISQLGKYIYDTYKNRK